MAIQPSDLSDDFVRSGKRLITQPSADRLLNRVKANAGKSLKAKISPASPTDRWSLCSSMDVEQSALVWTWWDPESYPYQGCFAKAHIVCSLSHCSDRIDASVDFVWVQVFALFESTRSLFWSVISENIHVIWGHLLFGWASLRKCPESCATLLSLFISADTCY